MLTIPAVRGAIRALQGASIHETFPAYLHLRHQAGALGRCNNLEPDWNGQVHDWLELPGGPARKPHFRPFTSRGTAYWLGPNLAGSYAPSSLRQLRNLYMANDDAYRIPETNSGDPDPAPIRKVLLYDQPIEAWAVAAYLYRNHAFLLGDATSEATQPSSLLLQVFQDDFKWTVNERESLFTWDEPQISPMFETLDGAGDE